MGDVDVEALEAAKTIAGPHSLFDNSFICEFVEPPSSLDATVLMRCTYVSPLTNALNKKGKAHPQSPPLHLHFDQSETFLVARGKVCTTETYEAKDCVHTRADGAHHITPWVPHTFWPCPDAEEDSVFYVWAHPEDVPEPMDWLFFQTLLCYIGDVHEKKAQMSITQVMVTQHASATAMVMFPTAWWIGPLRWWVPWKFQEVIALVGRWCGYRALLEKYVPKEEWDNYQHAKRA